ncbi:hypothetical protein DL240_12080 [Lujinxingia litoralis]|uniref:Glycosyl transferase family 51 domain-containing protein n=1 Tax=Lujinxingia litoralis TaxID=2211119 RepID=A0A328C7I1_9DELT|nr:biosynthetic peptidoglycan transglycosylase [Lujinxingia litoralis]RAL21588.1 hypothetical protein DL240_12080 [Lujinxingia litoralis]
MTHTTAEQPGGSATSKRLLKIGAGVLLLLLLLGGGAWLLVPRLAGRVLTSQIERIEARSGLTITTGTLKTRGFSGVEVGPVEVRLPGEDTPMLSIERAEISAALSSALSGSPSISAVHLEGVELALSYDESGRHSLERLLALQADHDSASEDASQAPAPTLAARLDALQSRALRHFGGEFPDVRVRRLRATFTDVQTPSRWPLAALSSEQLTLEGDKTRAPYRAQLELTPLADHVLSLPESLLVEGVLAAPLSHSSLDLTLSTPIRARAPAPYDFLAFELGGLRILEDHRVEVRKFALRNHLDPSPEPLFRSELASLGLGELSASLADLRVQDMQVDQPQLRLTYAAHGASNVGDLEALLTRRAAKLSVRTAGEVAEAMAAALVESPDTPLATPEDIPDEADELTVSPAPVPAPSGSSLRDLLTEKLPQHIKVTEATIEVDDPRPHPDLSAPLARFALRQGKLAVKHRPIQGQIDLEAHALIEGGDPAARVDITLSLPYRKGGWEAEIDVEELELSQLAQLGGKRVSSKLFGGRLNATLDMGESEQRGRASFEGMFAIDGFRAQLAPVAAAPIELGEASLTVAGYFDPKAAIPPARLLRPAPLEERDPTEEPPETAEEASSPPTAGAFVIERGTARHRDAELSFGLAFYGLDGLNRRPARMDVNLELPTTPVQTIIDAIPEAILGPLAGMRLSGTFGWTFALELPLYDAGRMQWDASPEVLNLEVKHLPHAVDVYKLFDRFEHTIEDDWEVKAYRHTRQQSYTRTVRIPGIRPIPAPWLVENAGLTIESIDRRRRRRGWPEVPAWFSGLGIPRHAINSPEYWLTRHATAQAAARPWKEREEPTSGLDALFGDWNAPAREDVPRWSGPSPASRQARENQVNPGRYGAYVFVPLHHISPYMVRAILTTEDNSFFDHPGFNFYAIKQSVAANLRAGKFVRGASTISMQLAKNLFLDREKVLARKFQEATLVWLMESVADVPKARLLEIYLNIIEYGPGVFGIHEAAVHYFGKRPDALTIGEVAWLVSIIPGPKRYHSYYDRGAISPSWFRRMSRYIRAMESRERITPEEMELALQAPPEFYIPEDGEPIFRADYERENPPPALEAHQPTEESATPAPQQPDPRPTFMQLFD